MSWNYSGQNQQVKKEQCLTIFLPFLMTLCVVQISGEPLPRRGTPGVITFFLKKNVITPGGGEKFK